MMKKVLVIGLDGATFDLIKPWVREGKLPTFARIMKEGAYGELESTVHPMSSIAWPSFMTGMNPGKHGLFDVTEQLPGSYDIKFTSGASRFGKTVWKLLSDAGKSAGVINVPMTYPPESVNGYLIAGMDAPGMDGNFIYPRALWGEIKEHAGRYCIEHGNPMSNKSLEEFEQDVKQALEQRYAAFDYLRRKHPTDLTVCVFVATDRVHHFFWKHMEERVRSGGGSADSKFGNVIFDIYQRCDEILEDIINSLDDDTVLLVMSDHGAGPLRKLVNLNAWLSSQGLLRLKDQTKGNGHLLGGLRQGSFKAARMGWRLLKQYLPDRYKSRLREMLPKAKDRLATYLFLSRIDWSSTRAYSTGYFGDIRINVKGREPNGIVDPGGAYENLREELVTKLESLRDPDTGERMVDKVHKREELYHGAHVHKASDLIIKWQDYQYKSRINLEMDDKVGASQVMIDPTRDSKVSSIHRMNGIFMAFGKDVRQGVEIKGAQIIDLAPTMLYLLDEPVPDSMDGEVLVGAFEKGVLEHVSVRYCRSDEDDLSLQQSPYTDEEAEQIRDRLQGLGYID
jgi:predicted AlkP superfamily phosphohydrolase/phosphomutase